MKPDRAWVSYPAAGLAVFLAVTAYSPFARADCMGSCFASHGCEEDYQSGRIKEPDNQCALYTSNCEAECTSAKIVYGAIAYDADTTAWGLSDDSPDETGARQSALAYCSQHGTNCAVVTTLSNSCAAVAAGQDNVVTWAIEATAEDAQNGALASCAGKSGAACEAQISHCYFP